MFETTTKMQKIVVTSTAVTGAVLAAPVVADAAFGTDTLHPEMTNDDVTKLQDLLRDKGYFTYHTSTGYFGEQTKAAVLSFQRQHHLTADGIVGPQTFSVLLSERSAPSAETVSASAVASSAQKSKVKLDSSTVLRIGDKSAEVTELQRQLQSLGFYNDEPDGHYGRRTAAAVRQFQQSEQLAVDGIAGPQTLAALKGVQRAEKPASSSSSPEASNTFKVLSIGDQNNDVAQLQRQLKDYGYYNKDITGVYGPMTEKAVRQFQKQNNLQADGLAGPMTLNKLRNNPAAAKVEAGVQAEATSISSLLRYQSRGPEVEALQKQLQQLGYMKMEATGIYGEVTEKAVRSFQKAHGLEADGVAGPMTTKKMQDVLSGGSSHAKPETAAPPTGSKIDVTNLVADAAEHVGTPYVWGGTSTSGFDCSGFLQYVFKENGVNLPRTVAGIYDAGTAVKSPRVGDIVFFETYQPGASHAGIYLGNDQFIHAGSSTGVTVSNLNASYWKERYLGAKRYF
ncbi:peptidoglycan-binding protein [Bacillus piscicola]|uniref:C40 family peptidase n=1 Tax=Bacillus piscicola TaxID=1632684 RepID=UPI001F096FAA|nr:peptidoglycan-binding protein [Bacillus piscicola]